MDTNGMDTYALVAVGANVVLRVVPRRDRMVTAGSANKNPSSGILWASVVRPTTAKTPGCVRPFAAR